MKKLFFTFCFFFLSFFNGASLSIQKNSYEGLIEESILNQSITPIPTGESIQSFCDSATVNDLIVNEDPGGIITWFDSATGGIPLDSTDPLVNGELVYAEQTLGGLTSVGRFQVIVHFISPNITANKTAICSGESVELTAKFDAPRILGTSYIGIFSSKWIYLNNTADTWLYGENFANNYGGNLISLHSLSEVYFIRDMTPGLGFFIGLNDSITEGVLEWSDGSVLDFTNFSSGEPNNQGNEDYIFQRANGQWNDYPSTLSAISVFQINSGVTYSWSTGEVSESIIVSPTATSDFWVDITINGVTCRKTIEIPLANPDSPISGGDETSCEITSLRTSATVGVGETLTWYDASVGGNIITNPILDTVGTITYYAESNNDVSGCISLERTPVTLTMNTLPLAPFNTFDITVQEQLTAQTITANAEVNIGETLIWYDASIGGDVVTDPSLSSVGVITYYAESVVDATGCISQSRTPVTLTILDAPDPPTAAPIQSFCDIPGSKIADLSPNGPSVQWYDAPFNGNVLDPASFLVNSQLVYASQTVNGIESLTRTQVMAHLTATYLATADTDLCLGDSVELQAGWGYIEIPNTLRVGRFDDAFAFRSTMAMNYTDAQNFAQSFGGNLASVRSQPLYEDYFSPHVEIAEEIHWFGLNDLSTEGTFSFSDGTPVTYTNWSPGQGGLSPDEDGVYFGLDGTWSDADITETHKFLFQLRNIGPSFLWSTGETTEYITVTPTVTAAYWLDVTLNGNTCRFDFSVTVNDPPTPGITNNTGATELTCDETSISLTATGGVTYSWSDGITTVSSIADLNITTPGTYTVTVTGANGCSDTTDIVITQNTTLPTPGITNNTGATELTCDETSISLTATGGVTYSWSDGIITVSSIATLNVTTPGTYTVTVTGANGCSDTESRTITDDIALPTAGIMNNTLSTELTCSLTSINITATGGGTYVWNTGDTTPDLNIIVPGIYTVKVTSSNGCTDTESIIITEDIGPNSPISEGDQIGCEFTILTASAKVFPGEIITWYDAAIGGNIVADPFLNSVGSVTYYAEAINVSTNCSSLIRTAVTLSIVSEPDAPMGDGIQVFCDIPTIGDLLVVGEDIRWYDSAIDGNQLNATLQLTNGQTVYASQTISGCESNDRISVNVVFDLKITPMFTQVDPICFGDTLLTLPTISINGYKGVWSPILDNTVTTTYTFTPDIGQCATNSTMTIEVYPRPQTPNGMAEQYFCAINSPMISDLILNTSFLNWYLTPNGGQSLSQNYLLTDGLNLFASSYDALNFCESSSRFKVEISVENPLLPDLETEISFCKELNPIIDFVNTNGVTMNWYDSSVGGELLTSEYILENGETLYAATFNTASGCESIDRLEFNIEIIDSDLEYYNAITIDSNNINDALRIIGIENFPLNTIEIYNRYGTLVWKNSNYNNKTVVFNGKANVSGVVSKDNFLPSGTYFFVLKYPNYCKQTQLKGFINIDNKN